MYENPHRTIGEPAHDSELLLDKVLLSVLTLGSRLGGATSRDSQDQLQRTINLVSSPNERSCTSTFSGQERHQLVQF